jgi:hypothetical protein
VQALGADLFNGNSAQLNSFKSTTGVTMPLMLNAALGAGNENLFTPYGDRDSYAVINKQGIVRYSAYLLWPYGNRYHLDELRGCIDSLVSATNDVGQAPMLLAYRLEVSPNPILGSTAIELSNPRTAAEASLIVRDISGRRIARVWSGAAAHGVTRVTWDGRSESGAPVPPGIYLIDSSVGGVHLSRRVAVLR